MTHKELRTELDRLGYRIGMAFTYTNRLNPGPSYRARSCYVVESDTGLGFANVKARRDANFQALQSLRQQDIVIDGMAYQL